MAIAAGVIVAWPSTVGSIPGGWNRVAALDSMHLKATDTGVNPGGTGGSNTHSHTTQAHTHTDTGPHTHTIPNSGNATASLAPDAGSTASPVTHSHSTNGITGIPSGAVTNATPDTSTDNNEPAYYTVIWIQSNGTPVGLPANCLAYWNTDTAPAGWTFCDGGGGTPDLRNKYLKGADVGADGGGSGGTATHTHTITTHDHGGWAHTHLQTNSASGSGAGAGANVSGPARTAAQLNHVHTIDADSFTGVLNMGTNSSSGTSNNDPPYYNLPIIKNTSGADDIPIGIICVWIGTLGSITADWDLCDGGGTTPNLKTKYIKCPNTMAGVGGSGGSLTSSHSAGSHSHTVSGHTHTLTIGNAPSIALTGGSSTASPNTHTHPSWGTSGSSIAILSTVSPTIDDNTTVEPSYYGVAFIQNLTGGAGPAAPTFKMNAGRTAFNRVKRQTKFYHTLKPGSA